MHYLECIFKALHILSILNAITSLIVFMTSDVPYLKQGGVNLSMTECELLGNNAGFGGAIIASVGTLNTSI